MPVQKPCGICVLGGVLVLHIRTACLYAVFRRRDASISFKLPHEVQVCLIAAEETQLADAHIRGREVELGERDSCQNDIMLAGASEKALVQVLKMGAAQA